jgi:hypothetical protein
MDLSNSREITTTCDDDDDDVSCDATLVESAPYTFPDSWGFKLVPCSVDFADQPVDIAFFDEEGEKAFSPLEEENKVRATEELEEDDDDDDRPIAHEYDWRGLDISEARRLVQFMRGSPLARKPRVSKKRMMCRKEELVTFDTIDPSHPTGPTLMPGTWIGWDIP